MISRPPAERFTRLSHTPRRQSLRSNAARKRFPLSWDISHRENGLREGKGFWTEGFANELHLRLLGGASALLIVTRVTSGDDVFPNGLTALNARNDVIVVEVLHHVLLAAILADEVISSHDVDPRKLHALLVGSDGLQETRNSWHLHRDTALGVRVDDFIVPVDDFDLAGKEFSDGILPTANPVRDHVVIEDESG